MWRILLLITTLAAIACNDEQSDCPLNSGWPCNCDVVGEKCDDDRPCMDANAAGWIALEPSDKGICMPPCQPLCATHDEFGNGESTPECIYNGTDMFCNLNCDDDSQCPSGQICFDLETESGGEFEGGSICAWENLPQLF